MSGPLKAYIAGVVVLSAFALMAATLAFPASPAIAIRYLGGVEPTQSEIIAGVVFWTAL